MMLPAVAARHWARGVGGMVMAAVGLAVLASVAGLLGSYHLDVPTGPAITLTAALFWVASMILGPVDGLWARWRPGRHLEG
jgi:zinc/manganese transport system permease protein